MAQIPNTYTEGQRAGIPSFTITNALGATLEVTESQEFHGVPTVLVAAVREPWDDDTEDSREAVTIWLSDDDLVALVTHALPNSVVVRDVPKATPYSADPERVVVNGDLHWLPDTEEDCMWYVRLFLAGAAYRAREEVGVSGLAAVLDEAIEDGLIEGEVDTRLLARRILAAGYINPTEDKE